MTVAVPWVIVVSTAWGRALHCIHCEQWWLLPAEVGLEEAQEAEGFAMEHAACATLPTWDMDVRWSLAMVARMEMGALYSESEVRVLMRRPDARRRGWDLELADVRHALVGLALAGHVEADGHGRWRLVP